MRIAIVHEWLEGYAGSERVTEQLLAMFPGADLFSLVDFVPPEHRHFLRGHTPRTSFIQGLPFAKRRFRSYLPLFPFAIQQLDLAPYDLVISCSHAVAKGVITSPSQLHLSYVLSPMRYAWDLQGEYLRTSGLEHGVRGWLARATLHRLRQWDVASSHGVDRFVTVSQFVGRRIAKAYGRDACVIPPPVDTDAFTPWGERENYYLVMARQVPYKRIDLVVQAFADMPERQLVVIGDGPETAKIRRMATKNVSILGHQPFEVVREHMRKARAFIYAAIEDFGIALAEAQAAGMPVIALCRGGAEDIVLGLETETPTGVFFEEQTAEAIVAAVECFESAEHRIHWRNCRDNAKRFSVAAFRSRMHGFIEEATEAQLTSGSGSRPLSLSRQSERTSGERRPVPNRKEPAIALGGRHLVEPVVLAGEGADAPAGGA
ncbi:MAG TPA: glycosyltransferase [Acetobacteraceae bacterium]|jgi:glycosyltransferase involved in cell wall biosynthesis|nr:glycosyltransferase [Acetobacteraceae bacterium]